MKNSTYKPLAKTVVTTIQHAIVDKVRRVQSGAHSVSTRVTENALQTLDVVVGPDKPYTLQNVHNVLTIFTPHPIKAELIGFGEIPEEDIKTEQVFHDAELTVGEANAGRFVYVTVKDADVFTKTPLKADVVNLRTGETENIELQCISNGVFQGFFQTQNNPATGTDFDNVLYVTQHDNLRITYAEAFDSTGKTREVIQEVNVGLDFEPTSIEAPSSVPFGKMLNIRIGNPSNPVVTVKNERTGHTISQVIAAFAPIEIGFDDTANSFNAMNGDLLTISTQGKDQFGAVVEITKSINVSGTPVAPSIESASQVDFTQPFTVTVSDANLPDNAEISFTNSLNGVTVPVPLVQKFPHSQTYSATLPNLAGFAMPGGLLVMKYGTATKNVAIIMPQTAPCEDLPPPTDVSSPLIMTINGLFTLNGSFAGTIKLYADVEVRCSIVKA